jgi:hypothetical protein
VFQRPFKNYADQRNWAAAQVDPDTEWLLHLDSDEYLTPALAEEITTALSAPDPGTNAFLMRRQVVFLGRQIKHGGIGQTWHLRLYRVGQGQCEDRLYDQHFIVEGGIKSLHGLFFDDNRSSLEAWTNSHNRWSSAEATEVLNPLGERKQVTPRLLGSPIARKRWLRRSVWDRLPRLWRAFAYFGYRYLLRLGFLDGVEGLVFHTLQGFWFRFLVDSKVYEKTHAPSSSPSALPPETAPL